MSGGEYLVGYIDNVCIMVYKSKGTDLIIIAFPITKQVFDKYIKDLEIPNLKTPNSNDDVDEPLNNKGEGEGEI